MCGANQVLCLTQTRLSYGRHIVAGGKFFGQIEEQIDFAVQSQDFVRQRFFLRLFVDQLRQEERQFRAMRIARDPADHFVFRFNGVLGRGASSAQQHFSIIVLPSSGSAATATLQQYASPFFSA